MNNWQNGSSNYSQKDVARMQQEAVERVREMQERSRKAVELDAEYPPYPHFAKVPPDNTRQQVNRVSAPQQQVLQIPQSKPQAAAPSGGLFGAGGALGSLLGGNGPISRVMGALGIDNDKIIVLVLLLVLINNEADKKLILALCYILL